MGQAIGMEPITMNHRTCAAAVAAAFAVTLSTGTAYADRAPVNEGGDTSSCVTYAEYQAVHMGMSRGEVRRTFDTDGHRTSRDVLDALAGQVALPHGYEVARPRHLMDRHYKVCVDAVTPTGGDVYVEFNLRTDRVTSSAIL